MIGSDIQEVVGSGVAFNLLSAGAIPVWIGCLITALDTVTFLGVGYFGVRYLEGLVALHRRDALLLLPELVLTGFEPKEMLTGWAVPTFKLRFTQAVGTLGAVIMPHNLYLHSGLVLSRKVTRSSPHRVYEAVQYARIEMAVALLVAFAINLSVVATNSSSFFSREAPRPMRVHMPASRTPRTSSSTVSIQSRAQGRPRCRVHRYEPSLRRAWAGRPLRRDWARERRPCPRRHVGRQRADGLGAGHAGRGAGEHDGVHLRRPDHHGRPASHRAAAVEARRAHSCHRDRALAGGCALCYV